MKAGSLNIIAVKLTCGKYKRGAPGRGGNIAGHDGTTAVLQNGEGTLAATMQNARTDASRMH